MLSEVDFPIAQRRRQRVGVSTHDAGQNTPINSDGSSLHFAPQLYFPDKVTINTIHLGYKPKREERGVACLLQVDAGQAACEATARVSLFPSSWK